MNTEKRMGQIEIKKLRLAHNMTQSEVADHVGVSSSAIAMYERGEREPSIETIRRLAEIFKVDFNTIFEFHQTSKEARAKDESLFSSRLKHALHIRDMKPIDLSRKSGISEAALSHYIAGHYNPKIDKIDKMATSLCVSRSGLVKIESMGTS